MLTYIRSRGRGTERKEREKQGLGKRGKHG
jgi:hypothetical protein